ncbi:MAG TPA: hypothetical protein VGJ16_06340, partial [Pirellulales bacterium]
LQNTFRTMIRERGGPRPVDQLHASFDVVEQLIESDEFQGCIFVNAAMEFPLQHEPAHVLASQNRHSIEDLLFELAVAAEAKHPRLLAEELCLVMEGAYVTRVVTGKKCTIDIARRLARLAIEANCCAEPQVS